MQAEWPIWRLVLDEKATLAEIEQHWSLSDVLDANEALDVATDAQTLLKGGGAAPAPDKPKRKPKASRGGSRRPRPPKRGRR